MKNLHFAFLFCLVGLASAAPDEAPPAKPRGVPATIFLIGDSTVKNSDAGLRGWGDFLAAHFDPQRTMVRNRALGGRSSRSYFTEGLWEKVLGDVQPGDFVIMQFGHNDNGSLNEGRARASLKGSGDETRDVVMELTGKPETVRSYGWYLRKYIADTKAKGATPIVLSLVPRNMWTDGKVNRATKDFTLWAADAAKAGGAYFVDLNDIVATHYEEAGAEKVLAEYFTAKDHTHTTEAGAALSAACVAEGLRGLKDCPLGALLLNPPK